MFAPFQVAQWDNGDDLQKNIYGSQQPQIFTTLAHRLYISLSVFLSLSIRLCLSLSLSMPTIIYTLLIFHHVTTVAGCLFGCFSVWRCLHFHTHSASCTRLHFIVYCGWLTVRSLTVWLVTGNWQLATGSLSWHCFCSGCSLLHCAGYENDRKMLSVFSVTV